MTDSPEIAVVIEVDNEAFKIVGTVKQFASFFTDLVGHPASEIRHAIEALAATYDVQQAPPPPF
jgi:hypothetical protein